MANVKADSVVVRRGVAVIFFLFWAWMLFFVMPAIIDGRDAEQGGLTVAASIGLATAAWLWFGGPRTP